MKNKKIKIIIPLVAITLMTSGCNDFDEINKDPNAATAEQVLPEYFLNQSILGAQMNPDTAERSFILYWKDAGRQQASDGFADSGGYNDGWTLNYWNDLASWLKNVNLAITIGEEKAENGTATAYNENVIQISRIWRAYLLSELSDNFGSAPIEGFQGVNPDFNSQKEVYDYLFEELKDAVSKIDVSLVGMDSKSADVDLAYQMDWNKWIRYGNSMRMRLAMRLSEVDPAKAKAEFEEAAATNKFISINDENFAVVEQDGWDGLTGVMSRSWNEQILSETLNNMFIGLGGIKSEDQQRIGRPEGEDDVVISRIKPENYIGLKFTDQYPKYTNDPYVGYFLDGLPYSIDPRAYKMFYMPGDFSNANFPTSWFLTTDDQLLRKMRFPDKSEVVVDTKYTWSTYPGGNWDTASSLNDISTWDPRYAPAIGWQYRNSTNKRVFFGSWESFFLIAEAAVRGWATPMPAEAAYNQGIKLSLDYNGVGEFYDDYIASEDYNRVGTSVKFSHIAEAGSSRVMQYKDPKTGTLSNVTINYPKNTIYKNGSVNNDHLTKIITQKFIANTPWLPLETWSDQRRLGLPFFENPAVDQPLPNLPNITKANYMTNSVKNFPQRIPYPSSLRNSDPKGYQQAVDLLEGPDEVLTPLWWAKKQ